MTERVLKKFDIEENSFEDYVTACIMEDYPHNSKNDYAAKAKQNIFDMGYLISLHTNIKGRISIVLKKYNEITVTYECSFDNELDAVFSAYDWLLQNG